MDQDRQQRRTLATASVESTDQVLERYYGQLLAWGTLLTRGDRNRAQDLVHDFWLHMTLAKPDLHDVDNLDGYLYKSLRHIYLSGLSRSSREALQFVNTAEFDSIQVVLSPRRAADLVHLQNDLRKICAYSVWRKDQTKSASYFILRFFHGYHHQEIAELACSSVFAIYNKSRVFRFEVRSYLEDPGKLQFSSRELPPHPALHWTLVPPIELFKELRKSILAARSNECLPEDKLLAIYKHEHRKPISCPLLSHIASCERCLALIDNHLHRPTLKDREPLDEISESPEKLHEEKRREALQAKPREKLLRSVRRHRTEIHEHRPSTLSIAIDGKILASRDIQAQRNVLSARIDRPENASFVEVFSEQDFRLALISIGDLPPEGSHEQMQRISLSDDRWLELRLSFDGLGLNSELVYHDPTLGLELEDEEHANGYVRIASDLKPKQKKNQVVSRQSLLAWPESAHRFLCPLMPSPVFAWSLVIACVFSLGGYYFLRSQKATPTLNASEVLSHSIQKESESLEGQTEHQIFRIEEAAEDGGILEQGTIELWRDGSGERSMRRLYDPHHRLLAAQWDDRDRDHGDYESSENGNGDLLSDALWKQEISPEAFRALNGKRMLVRATEDGYELDESELGTGYPQFVAATLVLDRHYHAVREVLRMRSGASAREIRFIEANYERSPSSSVPDAIFHPADQGPSANVHRRSELLQDTAGDARLAELQIDVLYQLNRLKADSSDPILVEKTSTGHVLVVGMVASEDRKRAILSRLRTLQDHQLLDLQLVSPNEVVKARNKSSKTLAGDITSYDLDEAKASADAAIRTYLQKRSLAGDALDSAVMDFCRETLGNVQRALQNASALQRLAGALPPPGELLNPIARQEWAEMMEQHASSLDTELRALQDRLAPLLSGRDSMSDPNLIAMPRVSRDTSIGIRRLDAPASSEPAPDLRPTQTVFTQAQFAAAANLLLARTKALDQSILRAFTAGTSADEEASDIPSLLAETRRAIPLDDAAAFRNFAARLNEYTAVRTSPEQATNSASKSNGSGQPSTAHRKKQRARPAASQAPNRY